MRDQPLHPGGGAAITRGGHPAVVLASHGLDHLFFDHTLPSAHVTASALNSWPSMARLISKNVVVAPWPSKCLARVARAALSRQSSLATSATTDVSARGSGGAGSSLPRLPAFMIEALRPSVILLFQSSQSREASVLLGDDLSVLDIEWALVEWLDADASRHWFSLYGHHHSPGRRGPRER